MIEHATSASAGLAGGFERVARSRAIAGEAGVEADDVAPQAA